MEQLGVKHRTGGRAGRSGRAGRRARRSHRKHFPATSTTVYGATLKHDGPNRHPRVTVSNSRDRTEGCRSLVHTHQSCAPEQQIRNATVRAKDCSEPNTSEARRWTAPARREQCAGRGRSGGRGQQPAPLLARWRGLPGARTELSTVQATGFYLPGGPRLRPGGRHRSQIIWIFRYDFHSTAVGTTRED